MKSSFISSSAIQNAMRLTIRQSQNQMVQGLDRSDDGHLCRYRRVAWHRRGQERELSRAKSIASLRSRISNSHRQPSRLKSSQSGLAEMQKAGDALVGNLTALQGSQTSTSITVTIQSATSGAFAADGHRKHDQRRRISVLRHQHGRSAADGPASTASSADIVTALNTYAAVARQAGQRSDRR